MDSRLYIKLAAHHILTILDKQYPLEKEVWELLRMDPSMHDRSKLVEILLIKPEDFAKASFREVISPSKHTTTTLYDRLNNWLAYNNIIGRVNHLARWVPTDARVWDAIVTVSKTPLSIKRDNPIRAARHLLQSSPNEFVSNDPGVTEKLNWILEYATQNRDMVSAEWLPPFSDHYAAAAMRFYVWDRTADGDWTKKDSLVLLARGAVGFGYDEYFDLLYPTSPLN